MSLLQQRKPTPQNDPNKPLVETRLKEMAVRLEDYLWKRSNNNVDVRAYVDVGAVGRTV